MAPGVVETPLTAQIKDHPEWYDAYAHKSILGRWPEPHELVGVVIFLASEASSYVTGSFMLVDGSWTATDGRFDPPLCLFDGSGDESQAAKTGIKACAGGHQV